MNAVARWRAALEELAIPEPILTAAPEPPWGFPTEPFRVRAETPPDRPSPTTVRALEALPERGTVLDVGVGGGATSLPLASRAGAITGIDVSPEMLEAFRAAASELGVRARTVLGEWPAVASWVPVADVVLSGHTLYNVSDLEPFVRALTDHARARVVLEVTESHPLAWMRDLWTRFHGIDRPPGPTADDAERAVAEVEPLVRREDREEAWSRGGFARRADAIALIRRRLCLPADRDRDLADALGARLAESDGRWSAGPTRRTIVTLWWDVGDAA